MVVGVVVGVVVVGVIVELVAVVVVVPFPESEATTASATPRPITTATRSAIAHFTPRLIPPCGGSSPGGCAGSGLWPM